MNDDTLKKILQRLNILVSLELAQEKGTDQEKISRLDSFGLKPSEIAEILIKSSDKISKQLYAIKSRKETKKNE